MRYLLPSWWNTEKKQSYIQYGSHTASTWWSLRAAPEKGDFVEHYGDPQMPMQVRMFCEEIYGAGPGGQSGKTMRDMMVSTENGSFSGYTSNFSLA